jgi:hypothetical protein
MKRFRLMLAAALLALAATTQAAELTFGGDLKLHLFDLTSGSSWFIDTDTVASPHDTTDRWTMGFERAYLFFTVQASDWLSVDIEPELIATSGATPELGMRIGTQRAPNERDLRVGINVASVTASLPWDLELSAGVLRPRFTEDYGEGKGFQEENRYAKTGTNPWLGAWHDMGLELYRPFELELGDRYLTLPVYAYLLNGAPQYLDIPGADNNSNKLVMLHVAPEYWKLRLIGSVACGKWDDNDEKTVLRYAAGLGADFGPVWLRAEYMAGKWDGNEFTSSWEPLVIDTFAARPFGYYAKVGVNIVPDRLRFILRYDYAEHNFDGFAAVGDPDIKRQYTTLTGTLCWSVLPGSTVLVGVDKAVWKKSDDSQKLDFWRPTIGWRTVF